MCAVFGIDVSKTISEVAILVMPQKLWYKFYFHLNYLTF